MRGTATQGGAGIQDCNRGGQSRGGDPPQTKNAIYMGALRTLKHPPVLLCSVARLDFARAGGAVSNWPCWCDKARRSHQAVAMACDIRRIFAGSAGYRANIRRVHCGPGASL